MKIRITAMVIGLLSYFVSNGQYSVNVDITKSNPTLTLSNTNTSSNASAKLEYKADASLNGNYYRFYAHLNGSLNWNYRFIKRHDTHGYLTYLMFKDDTNDIIFNQNNTYTNGESFGNVLISNGKLGISQDTPEEKLTVGGGNIRLDNNYGVIFENDTDSDDGTMIKRRAGGALAVQYASAGLRIDALTDAAVEFKNSSAVTKASIHPAGDSYFAGGKVGIGTSTFDSQGDNEILRVQGAIIFDKTTTTSESNLPAIEHNSHDGTANDLYLGAKSNTGQIRFFTGNSGTTKLLGDGTNELRMVILGNGNIGVGTDNPTEKLAVNGTIRTQEIKVEASPWPDYVFEDDYQLSTLEETAKYIGENKHLPEVPSAAEIEANGVKLGEMNAILLKKIEELTLHLIDMKMENDLQRQEIDELKKLIK